MDKDEGIRTLLEWFGCRRFRIEEITDQGMREIARLFGVDTPTLHGARSQLGKQLRAIRNYLKLGLV